MENIKRTCYQCRGNNISKIQDSLTIKANGYTYTDTEVTVNRCNNCGATTLDTKDAEMTMEKFNQYIENMKSQKNLYPILNRNEDYETLTREELDIIISGVKELIIKDYAIEDRTKEDLENMNKHIQTLSKLSNIRIFTEEEKEQQRRDYHLNDIAGL